MRIIMFFILLLSLLIPQAYADVKTLRDTAMLLEKAVRSNDISTCYQYSTRDSYPYIKRFFAYNPAHFLPKHLTYTAPKKYGNNMTINALAKQGNNDNGIRLIFSRENRKWKLNFPATMQDALGEDWEQQLAQIEQLYIIMQSSGGQDKQGLLQQLIKP